MDIIKGQITRDQIALLSIGLTLRLAANVPHMRNAITYSNLILGLRTPLVARNKHTFVVNHLN